jgi:hypothetical protein
VQASERSVSRLLGRAHRLGAHEMKMDRHRSNVTVPVFRVALKPQPLVLALFDEQHLPAGRSQTWRTFLTNYLAALISVNILHGLDPYPPRALRLRRAPA